MVEFNRKHLELRKKPSGYLQHARANEKRSRHRRGGESIYVGDGKDQITDVIRLYNGDLIETRLHQMFVQGPNISAKRATEVLHTTFKQNRKFITRNHANPNVAARYEECRLRQAALFPD